MDSLHKNKAYSTQNIVIDMNFYTFKLYKNKTKKLISPSQLTSN